MATDPIGPPLQQKGTPGLIPPPPVASGGLSGGLPEKLICVVCGNSFSRTANLVKKAKVCTPFEFKHIKRYETQPDGVVTKIPCQCCRCLYKKTMSKNRSLDGKLIPLDRVPEFLGLMKEVYPEVLLAMRVGLNAMLRVTEIASLALTDLDEHHEPLPQIRIMALKKTVKMRYPVDIDTGIAQEIRDSIAGRTEGLIFEIPVRTLQHKFKQIAKKMGLGHLSIHSLRHTGISSKAKTCKTMDELNYVRVQARHDSIETTKLYMGFEDKQRVEMHQRFTKF